MKLSIRDIEILRAIARLVVASTQSLSRLYPNAAGCRRRVRQLSEKGLLERHEKNLPKANNGVRGFWRLSRRGRARLEELLPDEPVVENVVERGREASLRFFEHRESLGDLYLDVLVGDVHDPLAWRARANRFTWSADRTVALPYRHRGQSRKVVPDATIAMPSATARIFVELDRSTETHKRIAQALRGYRESVRQGSYTEVFGDRQFVAPYVLYVTKTARRRDNLRTLARKQHIEQPTVAVFDAPAAINWLRQALFGEAPAARPVPRVDDLAFAASTVAESYRAHLDVCEAHWPDSLHTAFEIVSAYRDHGRAKP